MRLSGKTGIVLLVVLLALALVVTGCGQKKEEPKPATPAPAPAPAPAEKVIKIGFIGPLTGDVKTFGESTKNAFLLALEQAGFKAGDYKIEYVVADDRNDATEAVNVATKLVSQDKVQAIVGSVTSKATIPISEVAQSGGVVQITSTATNPKVTVDGGKRKDFVFRACFIDPFQGLVGAKFATETLKAKTAAVLYDQGNDYTKGLAEVFKENFEKMGGKVVAFEAYQQQDVDFSAVLTKIAKLNPDVLYLPDYYQKVSLIGKQARGKGIKAPFLGGDGWDSSELDFKTMEGGYFTNHYSPEDTRPEVQKWVGEYKAKYGSVPDALATLSYDATNLLLNAIKTANSNDPAKIKEAMKATKDFKAVSGNLSFDENGNPVKAAAILQIKDGAQKFVTTVNP
ncbi:branched-chain amino acid ABC transporter substrate-binding protein [Clostridiales bacterium PH28_bin88]|nr:branched-chain amino acid ABC transporter substrate-binding protein [Clostridiales bacterium PH28_bin88]